MEFFFDVHRPKTRGIDRDSLSCNDGLVTDFKLNIGRI